MLKKLLGALVLVLGIITVATAQVETEVKKQVPKQITKQDLSFKPETQAIIQHVKKGENDSAIELAKKYLTSNPNDVAVINMLAEAYINKNNFSSAETALKEAIIIEPGNPWSCRLLARIYKIKPETNPAVKSNNLILALEQIQRGSVSNPNDVWLLAEEAQIYSQQGDKDKANQLIDRAISLSAATDKTFIMQIKERINGSAEAQKKIKK